MGFSTIAANLIMFIAVLTIAGVVVSVLNNYVTDTSAALTIKKQAMIQQIGTDFKIVDTNYSSTTNRLIAYVVNNGRETLKPGSFFVFVNGLMVNRSDFNATLDPSTNIKDVTLFNPQEMLIFNISISLPANQTDTITVAYVNGVKTSAIFSS